MVAFVDPWNDIRDAFRRSYRDDFVVERESDGVRFIKIIHKEQVVSLSWISMTDPPSVKIEISSERFQLKQTFLGTGRIVEYLQYMLELNGLPLMDFAVV